MVTELAVQPFIFQNFALQTTITQNNPHLWWNQKSKIKKPFLCDIFSKRVVQNSFDIDKL